jgi:hypothetical protein
LAQPNSPLTHLKYKKIWATQYFHTRAHKNSWLYNFCPGFVQLRHWPSIHDPTVPNSQHKFQQFHTLSDLDRSLQIGRLRFATAANSVNLLQQQIQIPLFAFPLVKHAELQEISLSKADADADVEVNDTAAIFHKFESKQKKK